MEAERIKLRLERRNKQGSRTVIVKEHRRSRPDRIPIDVPRFIQEVLFVNDSKIKK